MNVLCSCICSIVCFLLVLAEVCSETKQNPSDNTLPKKLSSLLGKTFEISFSQNETKYTVVISEQNVNGSIAVMESVKNAVHVLGRNNETSWMQSETWILIRYGRGDAYNSTEIPCNGTRESNILIHCDEGVHSPILKFIGHNQRWKNNCFYMFEIVANTICPSEVDDGMSRGSVFCIIFLTSVGVYLVIGICYRRLVVGAKGFEQIPHHKFWTKLGNLQADGCNFICRREEEETWQRLTSNAKDIQDDQDDALLRP